MKLLKELKWSAVITSVLYIILGIILVAMPQTSLAIILNIVGIGMIVTGIFNIGRYFTYRVYESYYRNDFLYGIIGITLGVLIIWRKDIFGSIIPLILGIAILISGFVKLQDGIDAKRLGYPNGWLYLVMAVINVVAGILVILNPFGAASILFMIMGFGLIYSGISDLFSTFYLSNRLNKAMEELQNRVIDVEVKENKEDENSTI